jgi:peptide/nickel transport system substrate-binding protein
MLLVALCLAIAPAMPAHAADDIVVAMQGWGQRFDPLSMVSLAELTDYGLAFDGLFDLGPNGKEPALATEWKVAPNALTIDFTLRKGVRFHNGDPFSAEDVQFTFERIITADSTHSYRKSFQEALERVEVLAPDRVRFHLKKPWPTFFTAARNALQPIVPKKYYERVGQKGFQKAPVGTGPFKFASMQTGEYTRYVVNPDYWGPAPGVKAVTLRLVPEPLTRLAMLERGEADVIDGVTGPLLEQVKKNAKLQVVITPHAGTSFLEFNRETNPEFKDRRVRLAAAHAIDRKGIADTVLGGVCEPSRGPFTPATFGYVAGLPEVPYDPERARALLKEAGFAASAPINFVIHTTPFPSLPSAPQVLEAVAGQLEAVGFRLHRQPFESGALLTAWRSHKLPGISYGTYSIPDDGGLLMEGWFMSTGNFWNHIQVPEYDQLFKRQLNEGNSERRGAILQEWAKLESQRSEAVPLFWCGAPFAVGPRVAEWRPGLGIGYPLGFHRAKLVSR